MDTNFNEITNSTFTDPILKEVESVLFYLTQSYASLIKNPSNTHEQIKEFDKELGDFIERYQQLYNITSNLTEIELQKIAVEFRNEIQDIKTKFQAGYFKGDKGNSFIYSDFTSAQLESLKVKGDKGNSFIFTDFTQDEVNSLKVKGDKGNSFIYSDFTSAQLESLKVKGANGNPFIYSDFTTAQLELLKVKGDKGNSFIYSDFTTAQLESLKGIGNNSGAGGFKNYMINGKPKIWNQGPGPFTAWAYSAEMHISPQTTVHNKYIDTNEMVCIGATNNSAGGFIDYVLVELETVGNNSQFPVSSTFTISIRLKSNSRVKPELTFRTGAVGANPINMTDNTAFTYKGGNNVFETLSWTFTVTGTTTALNNCLVIGWIAETASATSYISYDQLEIGSVPTPNEYRFYAIEEMLTRRYYWHSSETMSGSVNNYPSGSNTVGTSIKFPSEMRIAPSVNITSDIAVSTYYYITKYQFTVVQSVLAGRSALITSVTASARL